MKTRIGLIVLTALLLVTLGGAEPPEMEYLVCEGENCSVAFGEAEGSIETGALTISNWGENEKYRCDNGHEFTGLDGFWNVKLESGETVMLCPIEMAEFLAKNIAHVRRVEP